MNQAIYQHAYRQAEKANTKARFNYWLNIVNKAGKREDRKTGLNLSHCDLITYTN